MRCYLVEMASGESLTVWADSKAEAVEQAEIIASQATADRIALLLAGARAALVH